MKEEAPKQDNVSISFKDLYIQCRQHWRWFVVSVFICLGCSALYILSQQPSYTRSASLLINENDGAMGNSLASELSSFADMGLFNGNSNVYNELTAIQSPSLISETVRRLGLQTSYSEPGTFHRNTLYGTKLPLTVTFSGLNDNDFCSFTLTSDGKSVELTKLKYKEEKYPGPYRGEFDKPIKTPAGYVTVSKTTAFSRYLAEHDGKIDIKVSRSGIIDATEANLAKLEVENDNEKNSILNLTYKDVSIERAENFLNTLIAVYNENFLNEKSQITSASSRFIDDRLRVIEEELGHVDRDISSYKSEHLVPDIAASAQQSMLQAGEASAQLLLLNNQLSMARYLRNFIKGEGASLNLLPENSGIGNLSIEKQISEYNVKLLERNNMASTSSSTNPLVKDLDRSLSSMRGAILASVDNEISSLTTQIRGFASSEAQSTSQIASNPGQARYLLSVERQQKVKESLYLYLLQKREENELSQAFAATNNRLITPPSGKLEPTSPRKGLILMAGGLLGLLIPVVMIFARSAFNTKVYSRKDLEKLYIPLLGEIPYAGKKRLGKKSDVTTIQVRPHTRDAINEAFRVLRTNIEFMTAENPDTRVILTTSLLPGSGKTFVTINLAASFSLQDKKTVVLDLDLRKATLSSLLGSPRHGVTDFLSGRSDDWHAVAIPVDGYPGLSFIPVGKLPPNPAELLMKSKFQQFMEELRKEYDIVIIDCPPVEMVADTYIISKYADLSIFVVRAGLLETNMLPVLEDIYRDKKLSNMTLLLNGTDISKSGYGYGYGYDN